MVTLCDPPARLAEADDDSWSDVMCSYPSQPIHLWQFLRELLLKPHNYSRCIRWLNKEKGEAARSRDRLEETSVPCKNLQENGQMQFHSWSGEDSLTVKAGGEKEGEKKTDYLIKFLDSSIQRNLQNRRLRSRCQTVGHQEEPACHEL